MRVSDVTVSTHLPVLEDLPNPDGARVLLRADLNVPLRDTPEGTTQVADDFRIRALMPTLSWLVDQGADVTVCSHLGRPKGKPDARLSMAPVRSLLESVVPGVKVMENLRFDPGEETNDPAFVSRLVRDQDLYVNDAFGTAHRAHASVVGPPERLPSAAGRLLSREVDVLTQLVDAPARPFIALVGGAKVGDKLGVLKTLSEKVDTLLIGGGMCFTFLDALGHDIGASLVDVDHLAACRRLLQSQRHILLPHDVLALCPGSSSGHDGTPSDEVRCFERDLANGWTGLDIGPKTMSEFTEVIDQAATVLWNGPMGKFEDERFNAGTRSIATAMANCPGFTVVGGGDTTAALRSYGLDDAIDHVSTGGGATLELIEKGDLPGLAALRASYQRTHVSDRLVP
jgi:phosphoglycerate kinase